MAKTTQIQIRCDEFQKKQLREMAEREGTTISRLVLTRVLGASGAVGIGDKAALQAAINALGEVLERDLPSLDQEASNG